MVFLHVDFANASASSATVFPSYRRASLIDRTVTEMPSLNTSEPALFMVSYTSTQLELLEASPSLTIDCALIDTVVETVMIERRTKVDGDRLAPPESESDERMQALLNSMTPDETALGSFSTEAQLDSKSERAMFESSADVKAGGPTLEDLAEAFKVLQSALPQLASLPTIVDDAKNAAAFAVEQLDLLQATFDKYKNKDISFDELRTVLSRRLPQALGLQNAASCEKQNAANDASDGPIGVNACLPEFKGLLYALKIDPADVLPMVSIDLSLVDRFFGYVTKVREMGDQIFGNCFPAFEWFKGFLVTFEAIGVEFKGFSMKDFKTQWSNMLLQFSTLILSEFRWTLSLPTCDESCYSRVISFGGMIVKFFADFVAPIQALLDALRKLFDIDFKNLIPKIRLPNIKFSPESPSLPSFKFPDLPKVDLSKAFSLPEIPFPSFDPKTPSLSALVDWITSAVRGVLEKLGGLSISYDKWIGDTTDFVQLRAYANAAVKAELFAVSATFGLSLALPLRCLIIIMFCRNVSVCLCLFFESFYLC